MAEKNTIIIIIAMALATYLTRVAPFLLLPGRSFHPLVIKWLEYLPACILAGLLGPLLLQEGGTPGISHQYFWATLPTFLVAWRTRNMFITVSTGMVAAALLRLVWMI